MFSLPKKKIMRFLIQAVDEASVFIHKTKETRFIKRGVLIYVGIHTEDKETYPQKIDKFAKKIGSLKFLLDKNGEIGASLQEIQGEILLISNFTLFGRNHKGTKMDFIHSAPFKEAKNIYDHLITTLKNEGLSVHKGEFGSMMTISSKNNGPLNYVLEY